MKNVFWRVFFSRTGLPFFFFFWICVIYLLCTCYSWVLFLKQKVVHCVLSFWLVCVMLRSYMLMLFQYLWISSQIEPDVTLCYHCMQTLELVQTKSSMSTLNQLDFPLGYWTWVVKSIKEITLAEKIPRNSQNWWLKSLSSHSFMKEVTKSLFSFPVY